MYVYIYLFVYIVCLNYDVGFLIDVVCMECEQEIIVYQKKRINKQINEKERITCVNAIAYIHMLAYIYIYIYTRGGGYKSK